jgi:trigger factor
MQVTETLSEGLKRQLKIVVEAGELDRRLTERLEEMKNQVQLKGFRPGKVPLSHLRRTFGKRVMPEVVDKAVQETSQQALTERAERPAVQPQVSFSEEKEEIEAVMEGRTDLAFTIAFEVMPPIDDIEFGKIEIARPTAEVTEEDVTRAIEGLKAQQQQYEPREAGAKAATGDRLTFDYTGRIDGTEFEGGKAEGAQIVLGSGTFIPDFEEQLLGVAAGEEKDLKVSFPADYPAEHLAGKDAVFHVRIAEVGRPVEVEVDDAFAKRLGLDDLTKLREALTQRIQAEFAGASRAKAKRALLDALDTAYTFELPPSMVESEFNGIWGQVTHDIEHHGKSFEDQGTTEDKARQEYRQIAARRVRLGLALANVGEKNGITVAEDEVNRALMERVRQFPGQEREALAHFRNNPQALAELRAPIYEDKVVDFLFELVAVKDEPVSRAELFAEDEAEEGEAHHHDHDHDHHDHDHGHDHDHPEAPASKAKAKRPRKKDG